MESKVVYATASGSNCIGCKNFDSDIMVTMALREDIQDKEFHDFFLSTVQAERLLKELEKQLKLNKERRQYD